MSFASGMGVPRKAETPETQTTPPVAAQARICSSLMLRPCSTSASGLAWLKITGFDEAAMMSRLQRRPVCEQSISSPASLTARTMRTPSGVRPRASSWQPSATLLLRL